MDRPDLPARRRHHRALIATLAASAAALVAACGGDGGSDAATGDTAAAAPGPAASAPVGAPPAGPAASAPAPAPSPVVTCTVGDLPTAGLAAINAFRSAPRTCGGNTFAAAPALAWDARLTQAALGHSTDMATRNFFSHTSSDGRALVDRIAATGYTWRAAGENIAAGQTTLASVMTAWQQSPGHCANLMNANMTQVGLSCVRGATGARYPTYWTMVLAAPR